MTMDQRDHGRTAADAEARCEAAQQAYTTAPTVAERIVARADYRRAQDDLFQALEGL